MRRLCLAFALLVSLPLTALGDIATAINTVRAHGCPGSTGPAARLRESARLDEIARRLASGEGLHEASRRAGYRAVSSTSLRVTNVPSDRDLERIVGRQFCSQIAARELQDLGAYRRGSEVWLVIAAPFAPPPAIERGEIARRVLNLTNAARARPQRCGSTLFPPAPPLSLSPTLERAAVAHSEDMAAHDYLDHAGRDGSSPSERLTRTGYHWRIVGENIASGVMTPEEAVAGWLASPHHCENLMSPRFSDMAVAYAANASSNGGIFWTQVFAAPR